jgi:hypothetical protein
MDSLFGSRARWDLPLLFLTGPGHGLGVKSSLDPRPQALALPKGPSVTDRACGSLKDYRPAAAVSKSTDDPSARAALAITFLRSLGLKGLAMKSKAPFSIASLASVIMA